MFCSQCAHKLTPADVYCPKCAKAVASFNFDPGQIPQVEYIPDTETQTLVRPPTPKPTKQAKSNALIWLNWIAGTATLAVLAAGIILAIAVIAVTIYRTATNDGATLNPPVNRPANKVPDRPSASTPPPTPTYTPEPEKPRNLIIDQRLPVSARSYRSVDFEFKSPTRITGGFVTYGGSNDIDAYIMNNENYELFVNGQAFRYSFGRPKAARSTVDVTVPPGRWHIVFSNAHALLTDKEVAVELYAQEQ